jgi:putative FmdB family regulatory protein
MGERVGGRRERGHGGRHDEEAPHTGKGSDRAAASLAARVPIYEYRCPNGHLFEVFHGMTEDGPSVCEVCGEAPLQRVLHPVAVHYKGSGFYSTDYGRKSKQPSKEGGSSDSSSSSSSSDSSSSSSGGESTKKTADT